MFDREMMKALQADGEKLSQLTGEDHTPEFLATCEMCCGEGYVTNGAFHYYPGHGEEVLCENCGGKGFFLCEASGDA